MAGLDLHLGLSAFRLKFNLGPLECLEVKYFMLPGDLFLVQAVQSGLLASQHPSGTRMLLVLECFPICTGPSQGT